MQFLIETERPGLPAIMGRQVALCPTLADVRDVAEQFVGGDGAGLAELEELGAAPEGELSGEWGELRFAPAG